MSGLQMEPVISEGLGQEFANTKAKYSDIFPRTGCYSLSGGGCGNTSLCEQMPKKKAGEGADHNLL